MQVVQTRMAQVTVAAVGGRVDHVSAEAFRQALAGPLADCRAGQPGLVLDLSGLDYISSAGLRVLMLAARQVAGQGGKIAVAALQPVVRQIFQISRFDLVFHVHDSVEQALADARATGPVAA